MPELHFSQVRHLNLHHLSGTAPWLHAIEGDRITNPVTCFSAADTWESISAFWHQALQSLLFASRAFPMTMKIVAAAAGAMAFQAMGGLFASPARAAWGWFMEVPTGLGFTCSEGTSLGCASPAGCEDSNFTCTVVPDAGMSCDVTSTNVVCSIAGGAQNFVPDSASPMCAQVNTSAHYFHECRVLHCRRCPELRAGLR